MSPIRYRVVDVFTDRPFAGNALCVVLDQCPPELMQAVAREVNLSETTFPTMTGDAAYTVRIFTPTAELPFAGHPSLGTAWTLGPRRWTQTSTGATVEIEADADGASMQQPDPTFEAIDADPLVRAFGVAGAEGAWLAEAGGMRHLIVATAAAIDGLTPDMAAVAKAIGARAPATACVVSRVDDRTLHVRVFVPGIGEDPGTGSAAGPISLLARERWGTDIDVRICQGDEIGRPSRIDVHAELGSVRVGGRVTACAEGAFVAQGGR